MMRRRSAVIFGAALVLAGCGSSASEPTSTTSDGRSATVRAVCHTERETVETAVRAYVVLNGERPDDTGDVVGGDLLDAPPSYFEVIERGEVVVSDAGTAYGC